MTINPSDYIAAVALIISLASAYYAKRQSDSARTASLNDYRAQLSDKHEKYRGAVRDTTKKHKDELAGLSEEAGKTLTSVVQLLDNYDTKGHVPRYLRHLLHECSEMVYYAFKGQLGWQTGPNIGHRLSRFMRVEDLLTPSHSYFQQDAFRNVFEDQYIADPNDFQENDLLCDIHFCNLVSQMQSRVDQSKSADLLAETQEILKRFISIFEEIRPKVAASAIYLEEKIEESDLEHFQLYESPGILKRLNYQRATLNTLSNLRIPVISKEDTGKYQNYISILIYTCAILHAIQGFHSWGWNRRL